MSVPCTPTALVWANLVFYAQLDREWAAETEQPTSFDEYGRCFHVGLFAIDSVTPLWCDRCGTLVPASEL